VNSYRDWKIAEMGIWYISKYPGFFIKNNKVYYQESLKSKAKNLTTEKRIIKIYSLEAIPYQIIVCEANKFYLNNFFQGSPLNKSIEDLKLFKLDALLYIWLPVSHYLLFTTYSFSMKNILAKETYRKDYEKEILEIFHYKFIKIESRDTSLKRRILKTEREIFKERLLNIFIFSGLSINKAKKLLNNLFLTENLNEIISFYKELLSQF